MKIICITPYGKHDYLVDCTIQGLHQLGHQLIGTDLGNGFVDENTDAYVLDQARTADCVLAFWSKNASPGPRLHLLNMISKSIPTAYIDGSEYNIAGHPKKQATWLHEQMLHACDFYFKRECMPADLERGVLPLPFSARNRDFRAPINSLRRSIDVFCAFGQNKMDPIRKELEDNARFINKHQGDCFCANKRKILVGKFDNAEYVTNTLSAKIGVTAHGGGEDCMRFWEILAAGAACFTQKFNIVMPHPFTDGTNMVEFETVDEFIEKAKYYLDRPLLLEGIAGAGHNHLKRYHTTTHRAKYLLESMGL